MPLCTTDGTAPTLRSNRYLYHGQCLAMEVLEQRNSWSPTLADSTPAGSYTLRALRTKYGLVAYRGMVNGQPTAFTKLRSTYRHEADSAIGFQAFNDPAAMGSAAAFQASAANIGYAFNWFYVNSTEAAYYNSGANPVRSGHRRPEPADEGRAGVRVGRLEPGHQRRHLHPGVGPPAVGQPGLLRQLEQQAGAGLRRGRRQLQLRRGAPRSTCSTAR